MIQEDFQMLVLTRKLGQRLVIGNSITVTVLHVESGNVQLGIQAPPQLKILRQELQACSIGWQPACSAIGKGQ
jgi:carbon storage regulator